MQEKESVIMKTLAMLGGMSYESTLTYYQVINEVINQKMGGSHSAKIIMYSFDYAELESLLEKGEWQRIEDRLTEEALKLKACGADGFLLCANTMHLVADKVEKRVGLPLIHIAKETIKEVKAKGIQNVGLLGTMYTMQSDLYDKLAKAENITIVKPSPEQQMKIHDVIYKELIVGKMHDQSRRDLLAIIDSLEVDGVILGCTELPLLIREKDLDIARFDTLYLHAKKAALWMLGDEVHDL
jgi:aspartate racemase